MRLGGALYKTMRGVVYLIYRMNRHQRRVNSCQWSPSCDPWEDISAATRNVHTEREREREEDTRLIERREFWFLFYTFLQFIKYTCTWYCMYITRKIYRNLVNTSVRRNGKLSCCFDRNYAHFLLIIFVVFSASSFVHKRNAIICNHEEQQQQ